MALRLFLANAGSQRRAVLAAACMFGGGYAVNDRLRSHSGTSVEPRFSVNMMRVVAAEAAASTADIEDFGPEVLDGMRRVGAGPRLMTPLKVKVYTIALFPRHEERVRQAASGWHGCNSQELDADERFWNEMLKNGGEWTMLMKIVRPVSGKHMQQGFDRGLLKRVRALDKEGLSGGKAALKKFNSLFVSVGNLATDCIVEITFHSSGTALRVTIRSPAGGLLAEADINNEALCRAIWEMFLSSPAPASPEAKKSIADGLAELVR